MRVKISSSSAATSVALALERGYRLMPWLAKGSESTTNSSSLMRLSWDSPAVMASELPEIKRLTVPSPSSSGWIRSMTASAEICTSGVICITVGAVPLPRSAGLVISSGRLDVPRRTLNTLPTRSISTPASRARRRMTGQMSSRFSGWRDAVRRLTFISRLGSITTVMSKDSASCSSTSRRSACS